MSGRPFSLREERFHELAAARALGDLSPDERGELDELARELGTDEILAYEVAAAAFVVGQVGLGGEPLPAHLAAAVEEEAVLLAATAVRAAPPPAAAPPRVAAPAPAPGTFPSTQPSLQRTMPMPPQPAPIPTRMVSAAPPPEPRAAVVPLVERRRGPSGATIALVASGWIAAAACVLLGIAAWRWRGPEEIATLPPASTPSITAPPPSSAPPAPPTPADQREALLARGASKLEWAATKDPASQGATGDVVWSAKEQKGTMRFRGLAKNDPSVAQYQLWIFDKSRDQRYPVDGGVFDVGEGGDVVVPIQAKIPVGEAVLFAITVEKPGGVVVSKRERIVLTAKPVT